jgi:protein involved in polysaccharide export with SLBB domain
MALLPALILVSACWGCASSHYRSVTPESPPLEAVDRFGVERAVDPYRLQVGDRLTVSFFYQPDLNQEVVIRPDGRISLMLVDDLPAASLTTSELDGKITEAYSAVLSDPEISVIVTQVANSRVFVGGEVRVPSMVPLDGKMSALQAIMRAGGFANTARVRQVLLVRRSPEGEREIYSLDLRESMDVEDSLDDVYLQSADLLIVPRKTISKVNQFVDQYVTGVVPLHVLVEFRYLYGKNYYDAGL